MGLRGSASRTGRLRVSQQKLERLRPWWFGWKGVLTAVGNFIGHPLTGTLADIRDQLLEGDANAAILLKLDPPLVAAYSEDLDAITFLTFPPSSVDVSDLSPGAKLLTVNVYRARGPAEADLKPGPSGSGAWVDFSPIIADFVSDDVARIDELRRLIPSEHWKRCRGLVVDYQSRNPGKARDGRPGYGGLRSVHTKPA